MSTVGEPAQRKRYFIFGKPAPPARPKIPGHIRAELVNPKNCSGPSTPSGKATLYQALRRKSQILSKNLKEFCNSSVLLLGPALFAVPPGDNFRCLFKVGIEVLLVAWLGSDLILVTPHF
jgi:hypothetical protein